MYEPTPPVDARVEPADDGHWTLIFVREFPHPPEKVWRALTEPEQIKQWAPYNASRDLATPGEATLTMIDGETAEDMPAVIRRAEAPRLLEYTWDVDLLRWELEPTADGTRLTLRHTLADRGWVAQVSAGWHVCLDVADHLMAGDPVGVIRGSEAKEYGWEGLRDAYATRLGVD